jgi:beta-glucosidase/6-phospho-beta-glucosidase/beta-galactosidase
VVTNLRDLCDLWVTVNEPVVLIGLGYLEGTIPPQIASPQLAVLAAWNLISAHRLATATIHELQPRAAPNTPVNRSRHGCPQTAQGVSCDSVSQAIEAHQVK